MGEGGGESTNAIAHVITDRINETMKRTEKREMSVKGKKMRVGDLKTQTKSSMHASMSNAANGFNTKLWSDFSGSAVEWRVCYHNVNVVISKEGNSRRCSGSVVLGDGAGGT